MKRIISLILLLFIVTSVISSCSLLDTNSGDSSQNNSSEHSKPESSEESQISYLKEYETYKSFADGQLHLVKKPISDEEFEQEFYTALVTNDGKVLYDFSQNVGCTELNENRFNIYSAGFSKSGLVDEKGNEIIPFGSFKSIYQTSPLWLYGTRADDVIKVFDMDGVMLEHDFSKITELMNYQYGVVYNDEKHILILNNDGTHELFEHDYEADLENNHDTVLTSLNKFFAAVRDGDDETIKDMMTLESYESLQTALENKELAEKAVNEWNSFYGFDFLAILLLNKNELAGTVLIEELIAANINKDGLSSGDINIILDNEWGVIFATFTLVSDGNGNLKLLYLN